MDLTTIRTHQKAFLEKVKARATPEKYTIEGVEFIVNPGVFPPATDSKFLASAVDVGKGDRILDVTTGSGIIPVVAGLLGASGIGVDINPAAVANAKENVAKYKVRMEIIESDLFEKIPPEKFDFIYGNGPFFEGEITDPLDYACYGARVFYENLFSQVANWLKPKGKLYIVTSQYSDLGLLGKLSHDNHLKLSQKEKRMSDDGQRGYLLFEITRPK